MISLGHLYYSNLSYFWLLVALTSCHTVTVVGLTILPCSTFRNTLCSTIPTPFRSPLQHSTQQRDHELWMSKIWLCLLIKNHIKSVYTIIYNPKEIWAVYQMLEHKSKLCIKKYVWRRVLGSPDGHTCSDPPTLYSSSRPNTSGHNLCSSPAPQPALSHCHT